VWFNDTADSILGSVQCEDYETIFRTEASMCASACECVVYVPVPTEPLERLGLMPDPGQEWQWTWKSCL
jgi:hypothetical protein